MANQLVFPRIQEISTSIGTTAITLGGAFQTGTYPFSSQFTDGEFAAYSVVNQGVITEWEQGIATYNATPNTLSRTYVIASSNNNNLVNFSAGTKVVLNSTPTTQSAVPYASGSVYIAGDTVTYSSNLWMALQLTTGNTPVTGSSYWQNISGGGGGGGSGTVTNVSLSVSNGITGSVATPTTTPAISLGLSAITPWSVTVTGSIAASGSLTIGSSGIFTGPLSASNFALSGLPDTSISSPTSGQVLEWNGSVWINKTSSSTALSGLSDVSISSPTSGQVLEWNGSDWENATISSGSGDDTLTWVLS